MAAEQTEYVLVTEYFHPDKASTGQLMTDLAVGLQERGLDLTVYTGQPNYHSGENDRQPRVSTHEGVRVKRIRAPQVRQSSLPRRLFNWTVFTAWMFFVLLFSTSDKDREIVFVSNPPFLPIAMWLVCRVRGWHYTYIVYDVYPEMAIAPGHISEEGLIARVWARLTEYAFRDSTRIVSLGPAMREKIIDYVDNPDFDESKVSIIHNWEDEEFIQPLPKSKNWFCQEHDLIDTFTILYSGNIGDNHDLETLVRAAVKFKTEPVTFLIIGEGDKKPSLVNLALQNGLIGGTVKFLPYQEIDDLPYTLTAGDVSVVTVSEGMKGVCVSSKLYTGLAAGTPILVISDADDDEARIVNECSAGMQVKQGDVDAVVKAIEDWRSAPKIVNEQGRNAREAFLNNFTKQHSIDNYYRVLTEDLD